MISVIVEHANQALDYLLGINKDEISIGDMHFIRKSWDYLNCETDYELVFSLLQILRKNNMLTYYQYVPKIIYEITGHQIFSLTDEERKNVIDLYKTIAFTHLNIYSSFKNFIDPISCILYSCEYLKINSAMIKSTWKCFGIKSIIKKEETKVKFELYIENLHNSSKL